MNNNWKFVWFGKVSKQELKNIPNGIPIQDLPSVSLTFSTEITLRLVHTGTNLRVQVVTPEEYKELSQDASVVEVAFTTHSFLVTTTLEPLSSNKLKGVTISTWSVSSDIQSCQQVTSQLIKDMYNCHGLGFGSRKQVECKGVNLYFGPKSTSQASASPLINGTETREHQLYRSTYKFESLRAYVGATIRSLQQPIIDCIVQQNNTYHKFIRYTTCS